MTSPFLFLCNRLPLSDRTAAHSRLAAVLEKLNGDGRRIEVIWAYGDDDAIPALQQQFPSATFRRLKRDIDIWASLIVELQPGMLWITDLWYLTHARFIADLLAQVRPTLSAKVVVDTVDCHSKKHQRKYAVTGSPVDFETARGFCEVERSLFRHADCVTVVSEEEQEYVRACAPNGDKIAIVPIAVACTPRVERETGSHICFLGNFEQDANIDGFQYFVSEIWQHIQKGHPTVQFHAIGYASDTLSLPAHVGGIERVGFVADLPGALRRYMLAVCPLRYGSGMKGKVGVTAANKIPMVMTSIAAQGFPLVHGRDCFIADAPTAFIEACHALIPNPALQEQFATNAYRQVAACCSYSRFTEKLHRVLYDVLQA